MNIVQPIRDVAKIEKMKVELLETSHGERNRLLFILGINSGLRISDILCLKVKDVKSTHIVIKEKKTGKQKRFLINNELKNDIDNYTINMKDHDYLIQSQKGVNKAISRVQAYRILNQVARNVGLSEIGTHTLRKTFGFWHYRIHKDIVLLQNLFNHSSPSVTLSYIGITQDDMDETIRNFYL